MVMTWILLGIVAVLVLYVIMAYNGLVRLRNEVKNSFANIDVQLKRRYDLIPNLVNTVKGYAKHEKEVLEEVTKARTAAMGAQDIEQLSEANNALTGALTHLFAVSENYPDLKASQNFIQLQEEITGTENKISYSRNNYNDMVMMLNTKIESFPANLIAKIFSFAQEKQFEIEATERKNVKVSF